MKISYAITVCNELKEIQRLIGFLLEYKNPEDEVVVLFDSTNGTKEVEQFLGHYEKYFSSLKYFTYPFDGHFANMKNKLIEKCKGNYIYQIDADEMVSEYCLKNLGLVLQYNPSEVYRVPRINTVSGLTQEHVQKWGWRIDEKGWVNFPDLQWRIYKNDPKIKWKNKVHEVLTGFETFSELPIEEPWCLIHEKTIERQEKQNKFYETI